MRIIDLCAKDSRQRFRIPNGSGNNSINGGNGQTIINNNVTNKINAPCGVVLPTSQRQIYDSTLNAAGAATNGKP